MFKPVLVSLISLCVIGFSWYYNCISERDIKQIGDQMQRTMVDLQHAEQRLQRLNKTVAPPLLDVLGEDLVDLQIRLSEQLVRWRRDGYRLITSYEQLMLPRPSGEKRDYEIAGLKIEDIQILRLDVQAMMKHAQDILSFVHDLKRATGGWPSEVRACDVQRMPTDSLDARCVLDIYFWATELRE